MTGDEQLAQELADRIVELEPMVVGHELRPSVDTVRLTLPHRLGVDVDLTHLRRGDTELVARRVVKLVRNAQR